MLNDIGIVEYLYHLISLSGLNLELSNLTICTRCGPHSASIISPFCASINSINEFIGANNVPFLI